MRTILFTSFICLLTFLFSCKDNNKNEISNAEILERDFLNATKTIERFTYIQINSLQEKATNPATNVKGEIWLEKAEKIKKHTDSFKTEIALLKTQLKTAADLHLEEGKEIFNEENKAAVHKIFITENKCEALLLSQAQLNKKLLLVDEEINKEFENTIEKITIENNSVEKETLKNFKKRFEDISVMDVLVILSGLENNVTTIANNLITFCYSKVGVVGGCGFSMGPRFLIAQNTTKLQVGERLKITAGIGEFSKNYAPNILINDTKTELEQDGTSTYELKISSSVGKYKIPVEIQFKDQNGIKCTKKSIVEYEVIK